MNLMDAAPHAGAGTKQLQSTMDKMKNMAVKRDSIRKSFIGDPAAAKAVAAADEKEGADDLSAYL